MLMRKLGRTGLSVAALCLGGNTFGWTTDQTASEAVLDAYLDHGGNFQEWDKRKDENREIDNAPNKI